MHAIVHYSSNIQATLNYHQEKIDDGRAQLIGGANFIRDVDQLSQKELAYHFNRHSALNDMIKKNITHFTIGFSSQDKISNETMFQIIKEYADGMNIGHQPWVAYRHFDTPVPHAHLVISKVGPDGKRISIGKDALRKSRELTHQLEKKYGLQADSLTLSAKKVRHGQTPLYPAMSAVLDNVIPNYRYTNLGELNAVLSGYNIMASRGSERSLTYRKGGLHYLSLGDNGKPTGAYITSSAFQSKPTWRNVQTRFAANNALREPDRRRLTATIDFALAGRSLSFTALQQALAREKIAIIPQHDTAGVLQKLWYIDHHTKAVFEDKALGDKYHAANMQQRTISEESYRQKQAETATQKQQHHIRHSF